MLAIHAQEGPPLVEWTDVVPARWANAVKTNAIALNGTHRVQCTPLTWRADGTPRRVHFVTRRPQVGPGGVWGYAPHDEPGYRVPFHQRAPRRVEPPTFAIHPVGSGVLTSKVVHHEILSAGCYRVVDRFWMQFEDDEGHRHFGCKVIVESRADGVAVVNIEFSNAIRHPGDKSGAMTDGELFYHWLTMTVGPHLDVVWQVRTPNLVQANRTTWWLAAERSRGQQHYLEPGGRALYRFVLGATQVTGNVAPQVLRGESFSRPVVMHSGPQYFPMPEIRAPFFGRGAAGMEGAERINVAMRDRVKSRLRDGIGGSGIVYGADWQSPNPGGMKDMTVCMAFPTTATWTYDASFMYSMQRRGRNPDGCYDHATGRTLDTHDLARANGGRMPWNVHNTPGAFEQENKSLPLPLDVELPWNHGECDYRNAQRAWYREDAAHTSRRLWHEANRWEHHGDFMAREEIQHVAAVMTHTWTPYEIEDERGQGPWVNDFDRLRRAAQGWGDGSLGRQIAWPLLAMVMDLEATAPSPEREEKARYITELWGLVERVASPTGCTRGRTAPNWGHANPEPTLPDDSTEVIDQSFELYFVAAAAEAIWEVLGIESARAFVVAQCKNIHHAARNPHIEKWFAYGDTDAGLYDQLKNLGGGSGFSQILNALAFGLRHRDQFTDEEYEAAIQSGEQLLGVSSMTPFDDAILDQSTTWQDWWSHETTRLQYGALLAGWEQHFRDVIDA